MNNKLNNFLSKELLTIDKLDTDKQITNRKRHFLGQRMIIQSVIEANFKGEFDE